MLIGASFDTPAENKVFAEAEGFPYRLLADADRVVGEAYEVTRSPGEQYGDYALRRSFLIDPDGIVRKIYDVTEVSAHPQEVLDDLAALKA